MLGFRDTLEVFFAVQVCDEDSVFFLHTGRCYKILNEVTLSWSDARQKCKEIGRHGDLASIVDSGTQQFVIEHFNFTDRTWFGGHAKLASGDWRWIDGSEWLYQTWESSQPNEGGEAATFYGNSSYGFDWYDAALTYKFFSFCQY